MRRIVMAGVIVAMFALGACSSSHNAASTTGSTTSTTVPGSGWRPADLATAKQLADTARSKGVPCNGYTDISYPLIANDYKKSGLLVPGAMTQCNSAAGENLTFEVFGSEGDAYKFMATKIALACRTAAKQHLASPTFPYVAATTWFVEPDNQATADRLAPFLGGVSRAAHC